MAIIWAKIKITWPPAFGLEDALWLWKIASIFYQSNQREVITVRQNVSLEIDCSNIHIECVVLQAGLQNGFDAFLESLQWVCFPCSGLVSHCVVLFVPLLQIRPTWTGTPLCAYFLLAQATTWQDVCDGEEVLTGNRYIAVKYVASVHLFTSIHRVTAINSL